MRHACPRHGPTFSITYPGGRVWVCATCSWRDALSAERIEDRRHRLTRTVEVVRQITDADRPAPFRKTRAA
jgi:hypothetical protein